MGSTQTFSMDIARFAERAEANMHTAVRYLSLQLFSKVVMKTPVDTGRARANWGASYGAPGTSYNLNYMDLDGTATLVKINDTVMAWDCEGSIFLANNLPYISILEYGGYPDPPANGSGKTSGGFSKKAPNGMVRISLEEMVNWMSAIQGQLT